MQKIVSTILLLAFSINFSFAQKPRPGASTQPPVPKVIPLEIADDANDFAKKGLPVPPILGFNPSDKLATAMAVIISAYDEKSYPYLIATIQKAGFYIIDENQKILYQPSHGGGLGLAFYDFEVAGMYKASRLGATTSIKKIADVLTDDDNYFSSSEISQAILKDLRDGTTSKNPKHRFLSRLIIELGRYSPAPVDLMTASPEKATINLIQASLIERVIVGDLVAEFEKLGGENSLFKPNAPLFKATDNVSFVNAAYGGNRAGCEEIADLTNVIKTERTINKGADKLAYFKALLQGIAKPADAKGARLPIQIDPAKQLKDRFKNFGNGVSVLNAAASFTKLVSALSNLKGEVTVEEPQPLVRTKSNRTPGEVRIVTAKFTMDLPNSKNINCAAKALEAATGVKFSTPKNGAMADKPVSWELLTKGEGYQKYLDTPVYLDSLNKTDTSKQFTDANGESKVKLTGKPQKEDLQNEAVVPIPKKVNLRVSVATEKMDWKEDSAKIGKSMLIKANPLGIVTGVIEFIPEIAGKMQLTHFGVTVPIRDWAPCSEDWGGTVDITRTFSKTEVVKSSRTSNGNGTGDGVRTITENAKIQITLNPRTQKEIDAKVAEKPAEILINGKHSNIFEGNRENDPCCGPTEGTWNTKFKEGTEHTFSAYIYKNFKPNARVTERDYSLGFSGAFDFPTDKRTFLEVGDTTCPLEGENAFSKAEKSQLGILASLLSGRYGQRFANEAGEILAGQKTINDPSGAVYNWSWELARCKK